MSKRPYSVRRGEYQGTADNRLDRWYVQIDGEDFRPFGAGYRTRREAIEAAERFHQDAETA